MFNALVSFSLKNRIFVIAAAVLLTVYGVFVLRSMPVDVFPDLNRPTVTIFSEAEGLAPEEVETLVTFPIETAMNGAKDVLRVRSASSIGLSIVWVEFDWKADIYIARQTVAEKLQQVAEQLPEGIQPVMGPISSIMGEIMLIGLSSDNPGVTPLDLRSMADWEIRPRLLSVPGLSQITVIGGEKKEYQVLIDPARMVLHGVTLHDVREALEQANVNSTGGFLFEGPQERLIRNLGRIASLEDIKNAVLPKTVGADDPALTVGDVADVRVGGPLGKRGDAGVNGQPAVILSIQKQPGADTVKLTEAIEKELDSIRHTLPEGVSIHGDIFRQAVFIEKAIDNVIEALRDGSILVVIVLFVFLLNFRTTLITLTAIPLSFVVTAIVFKFFGLSINTMTLGGLAVAIGELVDDAIVGVENVFRRLRENRDSDNPRPALDVVLDASVEIRNSIVYATIIVVMVFVPLFALSGIEGRIFAPLGMAYIVSIIASLFVAVMVTPPLCYFLLPNMKRMAEEKDGWLVRILKSAERRALDAAFTARWIVLGLTAVVFIGAMAMVPFFGKGFLPEFNEGSVTINILMAPGTALDESNRIGATAEELILQVPEVGLTGRRTGRAELDDHAEGVHSTEIDVELKGGDRSRDEILDDIRHRLAVLPGIVVNIGQPISHRIDHILSGVRAQIAVKIYGEDLGELRRLAEEVRGVMAGVMGIVDLQVEKQILVPQLHILLDRDKARKQGVMVGEVAELSELALQGQVVGQIIEGQRIHDLVLRLGDESRENAESIARIPVDTERGTTVPLALVSRIEKASGPNIINREDVRRRIFVSANVAERDLVSAVQDVRNAIDAKIKLPPGYAIAYGGQFEAQSSASRMILVLSLVSLAGIFLVLYSQFRSANFALQVMAGIPLAFIGSIAGLALTGAELSIATMIGFVTLTGIAARNGIMMIAHYLHLMEHEGERFDLKMIYRGTQERLVPVLMTALTASLALTPLVLAADEPGKEILHPVAVVIFSGLFSSTILNLIVTPILFWQFSRNTIARLAPDAVGENLSTSTKGDRHET
ncbi:MAG: efflux RND transporter permease subunit [Micavibrio aeruginosavorus]|uniref:Efflux RND transporter permease subunit n=1 Tax=Micavibrio aeruginosavorus TaxID=349221 RepID=A0A7T5R1C6_9BACT|nr:MAG: efflux RND transporter permease subunit [Micavibrio aeruginosavorus]